MKNQFIGLMVEDKKFLVQVLLAILKSKNIFVPINTTFPDNRVHFMLNDCNIHTLVTDETNYLRALQIARVNPVIHYLLCFDGISGELIARNCFKKEGMGSGAVVNAAVFGKTGTFCYVIYTSGSTGQPKGVPITHCNLIPLFLYSGEFLHLGPHTRVMKNLSYTFDFGVFEIFSTLLFGGRLFISNISGDFFFYASFINKLQINTLHTTPVFLNNLADTGLKIPSMSCIHLGGEPLTGTTVRNTMKIISPKCTIYNGYGPTEASINCTFFLLTYDEMAHVKKNIPIGKPCDRQEIFILDKFLNPQPVHAAGEICIAGPGLSAGYLNRPELTAEKFNQDLWDIYDDQDKSGALRAGFHFYKSGDLGRYISNGDIEYLGRMDHQVKIRGFRVELGEIESCLCLNPMIKDAVVIADENSDGNHYLCAYVVFHPGEYLAIPELREFLLKFLPAYMIPAYFIPLEGIPISANGKIDRKALPKPAESLIDTGVLYAAPSTTVEKKLVRCWQPLLRLEKIGIFDDFFQLGGDSILVNRCIAFIRQELEVEVPLRNFFEKPFIKALAEEIEKQEQGLFAIKPGARTGDIPLSFAQERLWFLQELDTANVAYFVPRLIRMKGKLDVSLLERTFTEIIRRHEILRTVFPNVDGRPVQRIQPPFQFKIPVLNWSAPAKETLEFTTAQFLKEESRKPFDFEKGPLLRVTVLKLAENEHLFVLTEHHLIHDGWTQGVLLKEFIAIFSAYAEGKDHGLPDLVIQYADFAIWERSYLQGERLQRHLVYWQEKLLDLEPVLELPYDHPRPPVMSGEGTAWEFHLPPVLSTQLEEFSRDHGVTLFMTMLAVFQVLLYRYTGAVDICVGTGTANRNLKEMEGMLGMVINTLPLRTYTPGDMVFSRYLSDVKETCLEAYQHQDTPFGKIVEMMAQERSLKYNPLFQVMFAFMDTPTEGLWLPGLELTLESTHNFSAKFDLSLVVVPPSYLQRNEILVEWEYCTDIFEAETMERMAGHYIHLLEGVIVNPDRCIAGIPMLSQEEIHRLLVEWNDTEMEYPKGKTIHGLFAAQVEKTPDAIAVFGHGQTRTEKREEKKRRREEWRCRDAARNVSTYYIFSIKRTSQPPGRVIN